jgi:hypothetical protein
MWKSACLIKYELMSLNSSTIPSPPKKLLLGEFGCDDKNVHTHLKMLIEYPEAEFSSYISIKATYNSLNTKANMRIHLSSVKPDSK